VLLDDREYHVDFLEPQRNILSLLVEGQSYEVDVDVPETSDTFSVVIKGNPFEIEVLEERKKKLALKMSAGASGRQDIKSPMAGNVRKVLVAAGDIVTAGQALLILEAMKMQNEITSPIEGRVSAMMAREGVPVGPGEALCIVEPLDHPVQEA